MMRIFTYRQGIKAGILALSLVVWCSAFIPLVASAQSQESIRTLLCAPREDNSAPASSDLVGCINRLYRFVVAIAAVSAVLLLAWAGYLYMFGGEESVTTAKAMMGSTIAGIIIILTTFIFLRQINPDIVKFKPIQPQDLPFTDLGKLDCSRMSDEEQEVLGINDNCGGVVRTGPPTGGGSGRTAYAPCTGQLVAVPSNISAPRGAQICTDLLAKIQQINSGDVKWRISDTFVAPDSHESSCHKPGNPDTGNCADLVLVNSSDWGALCQAVGRVAGLSFLNEASQVTACTSIRPYKTYAKTGGANLHLYISR